MKLSGKKVLVTGGTQGIGRALVEALMQQGCQVLTCARQIPLAPPSGLGALTYLLCDLSTRAGCKALVDEVHSHHPDLSVLIHNAAVQHLTDFTQDPLAHIETNMAQELALNLEAPVWLSAALLPTLKRQPQAAIVNITSGLALAPKTSAPIYCATKAALRSFTRSLRYQLEQSAPHVQVIEALPPMVDTRMTAGRGSGKLSPAETAAVILQGIERDQEEIYIGKSKLLRVVLRLAPGLAYRVLKRW